MLSGALLVHKLSWLIDQYEAGREIKQLERYGPEVVGMCKGRGTTDLWIPGNSSVEFPAVVHESVVFPRKRAVCPESISRQRDW